MKGCLVVVFVVLGLLVLVGQLGRFMPEPSPADKLSAAARTVNSRWRNPVCTGAYLVQPVDGTGDAKWTGSRYVYCAEGTFVIRGDGAILPAYCSYDRPEGCFPLYCVGSDKDNLTAKERTRCQNLPAELRAG